MCEWGAANFLLKCSVVLKCLDGAADELGISAHPGTVCVLPLSEQDQVADNTLDTVWSCWLTIKWCVGLS